MMQETPLSERIISIEELPELFMPSQPNNGDTNGRT